MASPITAKIVGTGSYVPEHRLTNRDLFAMDTIREQFDVERARDSLKEVDDADSLGPEEVFDLWARQLTGIRSRRVVTPEGGETTEDLCARAGQRALEAAGMEASEIDLLLVASLTASDLVPNVAASVAGLIGAPRLGGYVLNSACAGFVSALASGWSAIMSGMSRNALIISGDVLTRVVDYQDLNTAVVFGDGAGAAVLSPSETGEGLLGRPVLYGDYQREPLYLVGQGWETASEPVPKLHMVGGPRILRNAIVEMAEAGTKALATAGLEWTDVDVVIPHQANLRITKGLEKHLDLEKGRVIHNIENYGNMSASTVPLALDELVRGKHGDLPDRAIVVLTAIGGGYVMGAAVIELRR